ncbi:hypothetical protein [Pseudoxanthomonas sp. 3HH-4]|uniref:hypothetical protein n=1 Tax=Pseudoxanthomonas sp. 3HH-4 TaxID=1690214 RepID=UPI001151FF7C|nr:hypothetical protein [Pseudoxanthomonas sp. 3HH-4]
MFAGTAAISTDNVQLWVFTLEARPLPDSPDFAEAGGAFITCYLRPAFTPDPMRRAVEFVREQGWEVIAVEDEPLQIERHDAPEAEHFDQALVDDEVYVFHQWPVDDAGDETRH